VERLIDIRLPCRFEETAMCTARRDHFIPVLVVAAWAIPPVIAQILTPQPPPLVRWDAQAVWDVAAELQAAAEHARLAASEQTGPERRQQSAALADVTTLASTAQHFTVRLQQSSQDPVLTRQAYLALVSAHQQARQSVLAAGYSAVVMQDINRIGSLLDRLSVVYTQQWDRDAARSASEILLDAMLSARGLAREGNGLDDPSNRRALFLIERLADAAGYFRHQLDVEPDPLATGEDFRLLIRDYARVVRSLRPASFREHVQAQISRAGEALVLLRQAYLVTWSGSNARAIADQLRSLAAHLADMAFEQTRHDTVPGTRVLNDLTLLAHLADDFTRRVEARPEVPDHSYPDFLILTAAYDQAAFSLAGAPFEERAMDDFSRLGRYITQLGRMYWAAQEQPPGRLSGTVIGR